MIEKEFRIKTGYGVEDAVSELAKWLFEWSDMFDYASASYEDAYLVATNILNHANPKRR